MKILSMETSTLLAGVAVVENGKVLAQESSLRGKSHSELISPFIDQVLKKSGLKLKDIDVFAVGQGPGSFTGIRVGANAGKTFAFTYDKPLVTIDSLVLLAAQVTLNPGHQSGRPVLTIINAYKNMVYFGLFDVSGDEPKYLKGPMAVPVRELSDHIESEVLVVGDGWEAFHSYFPEKLSRLCHRDNRLSDYPLAETLGLLSEKHAREGKTLDWKSYIPLYIRASEAEESKRGILISPLK